VQRAHVLRADQRLAGVEAGLPEVVAVHRPAGAERRAARDADQEDGEELHR